MRLALLAVTVGFFGLVWLVGARGQRVSHCGLGYTCADMPPYASPRDGELPPNPVVYLFVGANYREALTANVPITTEIVERANDQLVIRVRITASRGDVRLRFGHAVATYRIGPVATDAVRVADVDHSRGSIRLTITGSPVAYRVDWRDGERTHLSYPMLTGSSFCQTKIVGEREFDLVALLADGSERHLGRSSVEFREDKIRLPLELVGEEGTYVLRDPTRWWIDTIVDVWALLALALTLRALHRSLAEARDNPFPVARVL
jgi:hypothetical protein